MDYRYKKGDLVTIKESDNTIGIVVDVLNRSAQNSDWDQILVYIGDKMTPFSPRRLLPYFPSRRSTQSVR